MALTFESGKQEFSNVSSLSKGMLRPLSCSPLSGHSSWLLRLFESTLFDMSIALGYLFNSKEPGVQTYLGIQFYFSSFNFYN